MKCWIVSKEPDNLPTTLAMCPKYTHPLSALISNFVKLGENLEVTLVQDNAPGHNYDKQRRRRAAGQIHKGLSRWQSQDANMENIDSKSCIVNIEGPSCRLRRPQRSRSDENVKEELNKTRFCSCVTSLEKTKDPSKVEKSLRVMALRQPQRQTTPDINYDTERARVIQKTRATRKPVRQLTPPTPISIDKESAESAEENSIKQRLSLLLNRVGSGSSRSPPTALASQPLQLKRLGSR